MSYSIPIMAEGTELHTITSYHRSPVGMRMLAGGGVELLLEGHGFIKGWNCGWIIAHHINPHCNDHVAGGRRSLNL